MSFVTRLISMLSLLVLSACGGGGGDLAPFGGTPPGNGGGNGGGTAAVADLDVQLSSSTIANTGVGTVTATVTALDANRNAVSGAAVTVAANSGALVTIQGTNGSVTDSSGRIVAAVAIGSDHSNRDITITATAGSVTRSAILKVVNSPAGATPTAIEIIAGATTVGTGGDGVQIRAFVKDANNNAMANTPVAFTSNTGTLSGVSAVTDASGVATATFSTGADKSNRNATITVSSGTVNSQLTLPISGTKLTLSGPSSLIRGNLATFDVAVTDSRGNVVPGVAVSATSCVRPPPAPATCLTNPITLVGGTTTNANGVVSFTYTATNAGSDTLVFSGAGATTSPSATGLAISAQTFTFVSPSPSSTVAVGTWQPVTVQLTGNTTLAGNSISFAATGGALTSAGGTSAAPTCPGAMPTSAAITDSAGRASICLRSTSAGPVTVQATTTAGGAASTTLPLTIVAKVPSKLVLQASQTALAPNPTLVTNNQVQLVAKLTDAAGNPVSGVAVNFTRSIDPSGGNLLQATATTDANGQASVTYRSGPESTASNGVTILASVGLDADGNVLLSPVTGTASLTVNQSALFIALGTGNVISNLDAQTYKKDWVVYVTDANGIAVDGVTLTIKAIPTHYLTGQLRWDGVRWSYDRTSIVSVFPNTYTRQIFACPNEDANTNGILDGGEDINSDGVLWPGNVIAVTPSTVQTTNGRATISLVYAESYAPWVALKLTASATVAGTESKTDVEFIVGGASEDFTVQTIPPAGSVSPFGSPLTQPLGCAPY